MPSAGRTAILVRRPQMCLNQSLREHLLKTATVNQRFNDMLQTTSPDVAGVLLPVVLVDVVLVVGRTAP